MRALRLENPSVSRQSLMRMAERIPGAWLGIRIAAMLLVLRGWSSSDVAELFDVSRWSVVKWIQRTNREGIVGLHEQVRSGRPSRLEKKVQAQLEQALQRDPREFGLQRNRWDGIVVVEYLRRVHGVELQVRQAQRWIRAMGFSLRRPVYRYVQASMEGVDEFRQTIKKTPDGSKKQG